MYLSISVYAGLCTGKTIKTKEYNMFKIYALINCNINKEINILHSTMHILFIMKHNAIYLKYFLKFSKSTTTTTSTTTF